MPTMEELEQQLAALRRLIAIGQRQGSTPSEILKLSRECHRLWAEIEECRARQRAPQRAIG